MCLDMSSSIENEMIPLSVEDALILTDLREALKSSVAKMEGRNSCKPELLCPPPKEEKRAPRVKRSTYGRNAEQEDADKKMKKTTATKLIHPKQYTTPCDGTSKKKHYKFKLLTSPWEVHANHSKHVEIRHILKIIREAIKARRHVFGTILTGSESLCMAMDRDGSGTIDEDEFYRALRRLDLGLTRYQLRSLFQAIDVDESGTIELRELHRALMLRHDESHMLHKGGQTAARDIVPVAVSGNFAMTNDEERHRLSTMDTNLKYQEKQLGDMISRYGNLVSKLQERMEAMESVTKKLGCHTAGQMIQMASKLPPPTILCADGLYRPVGVAFEEALAKEMNATCRYASAVQRKYAEFVDKCERDQNLERAHIHAESIRERNELLRKLEDAKIRNANNRAQEYAMKEREISRYDTTCKSNLYELVVRLRGEQDALRERIDARMDLDALQSLRGLDREYEKIREANAERIASSVVVEDAVRECRSANPDFSDAKRVLRRFHKTTRDVERSRMRYERSEWTCLVSDFPRVRFGTKVGGG